MANISMISPMVDNVAVVMEQKTQESNRRNKVEQETGFFLNNKSEREFVWTNFHCILCLGLTGFTIFWTILLLRLYLPLDNIVLVWWLDTWKYYGCSSYIEFYSYN